MFFAHENMKKPASKVAKPAQIQPKSQFLIHKNLPPRDFSLMTLCLNKTFRKLGKLFPIPFTGLADAWFLNWVFNTALLQQSVNKNEKSDQNIYHCFSHNSLFKLQQQQKTFWSYLVTSFWSPTDVTKWAYVDCLK